jgi:hypothetical protein
MNNQKTNKAALAFIAGFFIPVIVFALIIIFR